MFLSDRQFEAECALQGPQRGHLEMFYAQSRPTQRPTRHAQNGSKDFGMQAQTAQQRDLQVCKWAALLAVLV